MDDAEIQGALATLFRRQAGRLISALTRLLGMHRLDLAEDIVQESLLAALQAWRLGLPREPEAWLFAVARNRARDILRRERVRGGADSPARRYRDARSTRIRSTSATISCG